MKKQNPDLPHSRDPTLSPSRAVTPYGRLRTIEYCPRRSKSSIAAIFAASTGGLACFLHTGGTSYPDFVKCSHATLHHARTRHRVLRVLLRCTVFGFLEFLGVNSRACIVELVCPATERPAAAKPAAAQQVCHVSTGVACGSPGGRPKPRPQGLASVHRLCHTAAELSTLMQSLPGAPPCFFLDLSSRRPSFDYTLHGDVDLTVSKE